MQPSHTAIPSAEKSHALQWAFVVLMIYTLLVAVGLIGSGFKMASGGAEGARATVRLCY